MSLSVTTCNKTNLKQYKNFNQLTFSHQAKCHQTECDGAKRSQWRHLAQVVVFWETGGRRTDNIENMDLIVSIGGAASVARRLSVEKHLANRHFAYAHTNNTKRHLFLLSFGLPSSPIKVQPIEQACIHLSLVEVAVRAGHKVLTVVDIYFTDCW